MRSFINSALSDYDLVVEFVYGGLACESVCVCQLPHVSLRERGEATPYLFSQIRSKQVSYAHVTLMMICVGRKVLNKLDATCSTGSKNTEQVMVLDILLSVALMLPCGIILVGV
jgi:hypothetical protein